jgi:hypothetical protein
VFIQPTWKTAILAGAWGAAGAITVQMPTVRMLLDSVQPSVQLWIGAVVFLLLPFYIGVSGFPFSAERARMKEDGPARAALFAGGRMICWFLSAAVFFVTYGLLLLRLHVS